jgi:hypothetical protein
MSKTTDIFDYEALEAERTDISYRQGVIDKIRKEAYESGLKAGRELERDYVLQFVADHEFNRVEITARDVAKELQLRTRFESKKRIDDMLAKQEVNSYLEAK